MRAQIESERLQQLLIEEATEKGLKLSALVGQILANHYDKKESE